MQFIQDDPIHPGEILKDDFFVEYGLSVDRVAQDIGVTADSLSDILAARAGISAEVALRLSRYFGNSPEFWLNLQRAFDLALAVKDAKGLDRIKPVKAA
jgi:addiction module HigA family antidote